MDRFRFRARRGQQVVIETYARSLIPYLADAVPGWFQATLALYDDKGKEVARAEGMVTKKWFTDRLKTIEDQKNNPDPEPKPDPVPDNPYDILVEQ